MVNRSRYPARYFSRGTQSGRTDPLHGSFHRFESGVLHSTLPCSSEEEHPSDKRKVGIAKLPVATMEKSLKQQLADGDIDEVEFDILRVLKYTQDNDVALELSIGLQQYRTLFKTKRR